ncbi:MAG: aminotransferase class V-fold PLP-dependent enzyme, partial [Parcubacteria group bacterium]
KIVPPAKDGLANIELLKKIITRKTALVAVTHLSNVTGIVCPLDDVINFAHKKGALVLVDDAQYIVSHKENVTASGIDFSAFSGHKLGGPTGIGVLYGRKELLKKMLPYHVGGGTVKSVSVLGSNIKVDYLPPPFKFEAGVQHHAGIIGLGATIEFLERIGIRKINDYLEELAEYTLQKLSSRSYIGYMADYERHKPSSLVSFFFKNKELSLQDFNLFLNHQLPDYFIAVRCGHHCAMPFHKFANIPISMRLSFFIYNTKSEIDVFFRALDKYFQNK